MNLFNNGLFRYLEKHNPSQITDQLDAKAIINFCQYALEVQMYACDSTISSNDGPVKLNELDLPSVSTSIEIPGVSAKTLSNSQKDLCNIICAVNRESTNLPETLRNLKEKMRQSLKEKEKPALTKTKYHGVYQQDNLYIVFFEKFPGQRTEKIGEFRNLTEAAKVYDQYIIKKDLNYRKKPKDEGYYHLNFPSRSKSRSRSTSSRRIRRKETNERRSNESNRRYRERDRSKDKYHRDNERRESSPYNKRKEFGSNSYIKPSNFQNQTNQHNKNSPKEGNLAPASQKNLAKSANFISNINSNNNPTQNISNQGKKKNLPTTQYQNNMYQPYPYPNTYNSYVNKPPSGFYMNENNSTNYGYNQNYYNNNPNYYQSFQQNTIGHNHNLYNQNHIYQNYLQSQQPAIVNQGYNNNNQFTNQTISNPNEIMPYGYKRNYSQNTNNYLNYNVAPNNAYTLQKCNPNYDEDGKKGDENKKAGKNDQIQNMEVKATEEKKQIGEPNTMVIHSEINQNINY